MSVSESDSEILSESYQGSKIDLEPTTTRADVAIDTDADVFDATDVKVDTFASANFKNKTTNSNLAGK
jgi:hypothetical protein